MALAACPVLLSSRLTTKNEMGETGMALKSPVLLNEACELQSGGGVSEKRLLTPWIRFSTRSRVTTLTHHIHAHEDRVEATPATMRNVIYTVLVATMLFLLTPALGFAYVPRHAVRLTSRARPSRAHVWAMKTFTLEVASSMIARPDKAARGGDDAYFVNAGESGATLDLGVFDGVGGWARRGHDPGVFSRGFAKAVAANITAQRTEQAVSVLRLKREGEASPRFEKGVDLQQALEYATTNAALAGTQGTCTACVVTFDPVYGMLNGLNVGDSGALLVRRDARGVPFVALRTATQRHKFNQPYQLGTGSRDKAHDAREFLFYVREGDIVILATDGLLDNMYEADILRCIHEASDGATVQASTERPLDLAAALASRAFALSRDKERLSPWEEEAVAAGVIPVRGSVDQAPVDGKPRESSWDAGKWGLAIERAFNVGLNGFRRGSERAAQGEDQGDSSMPEEDMTDFRGGKMDDITVVVATVRRSGSRSNNAAQGGGKERTGGIDGARVPVDSQVDSR